MSEPTVGRIEKISDVPYRRKLSYTPEQLASVSDTLKKMELERTFKTRVGALLRKLQRIDFDVEDDYRNEINDLLREAEAS